MTVVEELYRPFTTIVNEMLKLRVTFEHCMVVDLLIVTVVLNRFISILEVFIYLFVLCLNFILKCQYIDYFAV